MYVLAHVQKGGRKDTRARYAEAGGCLWIRFIVAQIEAFRRQVRKMKTTKRRSLFVKSTSAVLSQF